MSDTYTYTGTLSKTVGTLQEELKRFTYNYTADEQAAPIFVIPEVDAAELSVNTEVFKVDMSYINSTPPLNGRVKFVMIEVMTSGKRVEVKVNVPSQIVTAMESGSPITPVSDAAAKFHNSAYTDVTGSLVYDAMIIGGKIENIYINRFPLTKTGHDVTADAGDCRVSVRVIGG
jgi:hypothetical protein